MFKFISEIFLNHFLNYNKEKLKKWIAENIVSEDILNEKGQPNGNSKIVDNAYLSKNIKNIMAVLAKQRELEIQNESIQYPNTIGLQSKLATQADIESVWARYWLNKICIPFRYHRKCWEVAFILQVLYEHGMFGKKGLGLACGTERLPSYLISQNCSIVAGDKPIDVTDAEQESWASSNQYTASRESLFYKDIVDKNTFDSNFILKYVDMNRLSELSDERFDFCWSVCALEHLGSIDNGLKFLKNSLKVLKKNGISVHTTEFNLFSNSTTIDNWGSVLFTEKHLTQLEKDVAALGGKVYPFDFSPGRGLFDQYIDMPPFPHQPVAGIKELLPGPLPPHIKLLIDGIPATCVGIIIERLAD